MAPDPMSTIPERLASIEAQLKALNVRLDEVVITQLKDHGKRLQSLEARQLWLAGWVAGAGVIGAGILWLLEKI